MCRMPVALSKYKYRYNRGEFTAVHLRYSDLGAVLAHVRSKFERELAAYEQLRVVLREGGEEELYSVVELLKEEPQGPVHLEVTLAQGEL